MEFDRYTFVLLVRPPDAPDYDDDELDRIQDAHLAYRADLRDQGKILVSGPLLDQPDERLRGISVFAVDRDEALRLSDQDPAVRAGRLASEVMTWMVPAGNVTFNDVRAPRSTAEVDE